MRRSVLMGMLALSLLLTGLLAVDSRFIVLALPVWVYLGAALLDAPEPVPALTVTRSIDPPVVTEGEPVTVTVQVRNDGAPFWNGARSVWLRVAEYLPASLPVCDGDLSGMALLAPTETLTLTYTFTAHRGDFMFDDIEVETFDALGLLRQAVRKRSSVDAPLDAHFTALPRVDKWRPVSLRPLRTLGFTGPIPSRQGGTGTDVYSVREYHPGDPLRHINWRATARHHNRAFTTEFEQERIIDVGLILDIRQQTSLRGGRAGSLPESLLDHSIRATAALSDTLLHAGHRVGLQLYGRGNQWIFPGYGRVQQRRILQTLAGAKAAENDFFDRLQYLSTRVFPARSQLIFVSPLLPDDHDMLFRLRSYRYSVLVICPDIVAFQAQAAAPPLPPLAVRLARLERAVLLHRLRQGGIVVVDWPVETALEEKLRAATVQARVGAHSLYSL
jgi:uncharacterized protein (DUF58 family)